MPSEIPSIEEWLAAACGTDDELESAIVALQVKKGLSQREKLELEQLKTRSQARFNEISDCKLTKIDSSRDAITEFDLPAWNGNAWVLVLDQSTPP